MLKNDYSLATIGADTADHEHSEVSFKSKSPVGFYMVASGGIEGANAPTRRGSAGVWLGSLYSPSEPYVID